MTLRTNISICNSHSLQLECNKTHHVWQDNRENERESKSSRTSYRRCSSDKVALEGNTHESKERGADIAAHPPEKKLRLF